MAIKDKYLQCGELQRNRKTRKCQTCATGCTREPNNQDTDILEISPLLMEAIDGVDEISKGRFGTVCLKKFRSIPVAVKYFNLSSTAKGKRGNVFKEVLPYQSSYIAWHNFTLQT